MKRLILTLTALILSTSASATSMKTWVSAEIQTLNIQSGTFLSEKQPIGGELQMDIFHEKMSLVLNLPGTCPKNAMCIWAGPEPIRYDFKVESVTTGGCGETIVKSKAKALEEGGPIATLTVTDYSTLTCKYFPAAWVEAELNVRGFVPETHTMTATRFH